MDFSGNGAIGFQIPFSQGSLVRLGVMSCAIRPEPMVPMNKLLSPLDGGLFPRLSRFLWPMATLLVLLPWVDGTTALLGGALLALVLGNPHQDLFRRWIHPLLGGAVVGASAWITGLRREQASSRSAVDPFQWDPANGGLVKVNPLCGWSLDQVWAYVRAHDVPYNPLHDQGYPSIGCAPCTRAVQPGEDVRSGRWWWEQPEHKECGLHNPSRIKAMP
jgi:hypothetical protein